MASSNLLSMALDDIVKINRKKEGRMGHKRFRRRAAPYAVCFLL